MRIGHHGPDAVGHGSPTMSDFDAVLWDFGGIFTASPFVAVEAYARAQDVEFDVFAEVVFGAYDTDTDHVWHQLERGEVAFLEALVRIQSDAEAAGFRFDTGELLSMMVVDQVDRSAVVDAVRSVRSKGLRTAIVTNNIREFGDAWRALIPLDELFDVVVDSCEEGVRKPDPAIFRTALERLDVGDPARAIFLDDFAGNVAAARGMGMHGILVGEDPASALAELRALVE
jgi:putative hydrolase of the HAD superfamily